MTESEFLKTLILYVVQYPEGITTEEDIKELVFQYHHDYLSEDVEVEIDWDTGKVFATTESGNRRTYKVSKVNQGAKMKESEALLILLGHPDVAVQNAAKLLDDAGNRRKKILGAVRSAIGQLRLDMKYLVFDLEATRRERDALKGTA